MCKYIFWCARYDRNFAPNVSIDRTTCIRHYESDWDDVEKDECNGGMPQRRSFALSAASTASCADNRGVAHGYSDSAFDEEDRSDSESVLSDKRECQSLNDSMWDVPSD